MQPNKARTPWGFVASLTTVLIVGATLVIIVSLLALIPSSGWSKGDALEGHMCVTTPTDVLENEDESAFSRPDPDGVRTATTQLAHCKAYDAFGHSYGAQVLDQIEGTPTAIAVLGLALGLRRIINRTRDDGPFQPEAVRLLRGFRWWVAGALGAALVIEGILRGIRERLLTDELWPGLDFVGPVVVAFILAHAVLALCDFGVRQREDAARHGLDEPPADDSR